MADVSSIKTRQFHVFDGSPTHQFDKCLQQIRKGDQFRASDESPWAVWVATSDPYLNGDDVWTIQADMVAG